MKKNNLIYGLVCILLAGITLYAAISFGENKMVGGLYGLTGVLGGNGIYIIVRYFYWLTNKEKFQEKLQVKQIEQQDELKQKIREKSGTCTNLIGNLIILVSIMVYLILNVLDIMDTTHIIIFLVIYLISQVVIEIIVFNHLLKKYE